MNTFLVAYQLENKENYMSLSEKIKTFSHWAKPLEGVWIIKSDKKAGEIRDILSEAIAKEGKIMVINLDNKAWGTFAISKEVTAWMKEKI